MKQFDAIIIGFGKGGKTLAAELAKREQKVAVIERSDKMYGGTCINIGCIPTKTLVHLSKLTPAGSSFKEKENITGRQLPGRRKLLRCYGRKTIIIWLITLISRYIQEPVPLKTKRW